MRHSVTTMTLFAFLASACAPQPAAPVSSLDQRTAVVLPPVEFEAVHAEMRTMLSSLHDVHMGLATRDTALMLRGAEASGLAAAADPGLKPLLPAEFMNLGVAAHTTFDEFAEAVRGGQPMDSLIAHLPRLTVSCTTCHATYHLVLGEPAQAP